ncbi:elongation factor P [Candidatus Gracilibacteria bacterium]|nr:elongation factor P [Candidatus Gracilibacteria bacterium]
MYNASELKVGKKFLMEDTPYEVLTYAQKVVGRGGSIITVKCKNLLSGGIVTKTFSDKDNFPPADIVTQSYDYLYNDGESYFFMNRESYEQVELPLERLDGAELFLTEGDKVMLQEFNGQAINIALEPSCILVVEDTPPGEKGDTATGGRKPATCITGLVVQVPLFVNIGDKIKVDTRTREYQSRA